jgi:uncharacterized protein
MDRTVMWSPLRWPGSEHTVVHDVDGTIVVDGMVIVAEGQPLRVHYRLTCDQSWTTQRLHVDVHGRQSASLVRAPDGSWSDDAGPRPDLDGCVDVDISVTPFTNTLPIRRLAMSPDTSTDLRMVYVLVGPPLEVTTSEQRYTHLGLHPGGSLYRYQSGDFQADLAVDGDGLVVDYPGLWRQEHVM